MESKTIWRGGYDDVRPVEVSRESHTLPDGKLLEDYYETEVQAWAGILSANELAVAYGVQRHREALAECAGALRDLVRRRRDNNKVVGAYDNWRRVYADEGGRVVRIESSTSTQGKNHGEEE